MHLLKDHHSGLKYKYGTKDGNSFPPDKGLHAAQAPFEAGVLGAKHPFRDSGPFFLG